MQFEEEEEAELHHLFAERFLVSRPREHMHIVVIRFLAP